MDTTTSVLGHISLGYYVPFKGILGNPRERFLNLAKPPESNAKRVMSQKYEVCVEKI